MDKIKFTKIQNPNNWNMNTIKFKGDIFAFKKIKNRLFVFCPNSIYEIVKKKDGLKKVKVLCPKP